MAAALFGFSDLATTQDLVKTWLAYIGPFASSIVAFYFGTKPEKQEKVRAPKVTPAD
jgi:hypothetical protein